MSAKILTIDLERSPATVVTFSFRNTFIGIDQILEPSRTISYAAKWLGEKEILFASDFHDGHDEMVRSAHALVDEADILVTYNGKRFDYPHLLTEFDLAGLKPPSPVGQVDLFQTISKRHSLDSSKLNWALKSFDLPLKVENAGMRLWIACMNGDPKAWDKMARYNKNDVIVTEKLYKRILPYISNHPHLGVFEGPGQHCPNCGSTRLQRRGEQTTQQGLYVRLHCQKCGKWSRGTKTIQAYQEAVGVA